MENIQIDPQSYRDFIKQIDIVDIHIESLTAKRLGEPSDKGIITIKCNPEQHDLKNGYLTVCFSAGVHGDNADSKLEVFQVAVTYKLIYKLNQEPPNPKYIDLFIGNNVIIHVWPYLRELVNNLSYRMHLPPVVLNPQVR